MTIMPPDGPAPDGTWAQVLLKLGEMAVDVGQIKTRLDMQADMPKRLHDVELAIERNQGGRDLASRVIAVVALVVTLAAAAAAWVAVARR